MTLRILVDMNLSPDWVPALARGGYAAIHWSAVGDPRASDRELMDWAVANGHVVLTHDLDFGMILALTHAAGPSVIQVRARDVLPDHLAGIVVATLQRHEKELLSGAIIVVDEWSARVRLLPL